MASASCNRPLPVPARQWFAAGRCLRAKRSREPGSPGVFRVAANEAAVSFLAVAFETWPLAVWRFRPVSALMSSAWCAANCRRAMPIPASVGFTFAGSDPQTSACSKQTSLASRASSRALRRTGDPCRLPNVSADLQAKVAGTPAREFASIDLPRRAGHQISQQSIGLVRPVRIPILREPAGWANRHNSRESPDSHRQFGENSKCT